MDLQGSRVPFMYAPRRRMDLGIPFVCPTIVYGTGARRIRVADVEEEDGHDQSNITTTTKQHRTHLEEREHHANDAPNRKKSKFEPPKILHNTAPAHTAGKCEALPVRPRWQMELVALISHPKIVYGIEPRGVLYVAGERERAEACRLKWCFQDRKLRVGHCTMRQVIRKASTSASNLDEALHITAPTGTMKEPVFTNIHNAVTNCNSLHHGGTSLRHDYQNTTNSSEHAICATDVLATRPVADGVSIVQRQHLP